MYPPKEAIIRALNASFPTVFTSGTIMASAGNLIAVMTANPVIATFGVCIGRGTIISIILVMAVLPQILVLGDILIERTRFRLPQLAERKSRVLDGRLRVNGHVRGYIQGVVDADISGILTGSVHASVTTGDVEMLDGTQTMEGGTKA